VLLAASRATGLPATAGNRVDLLVDNVEAFAERHRAIAAAKTTPWAEYYIVHGDATGVAFLDAMAAAASRGVDVRLLYDAVGSIDIDDDALDRLRAAGGHVAAFHPVNPLRRRWAVHLRNHRKVLVADGRVAFVGGMNIGDSYAGRGEAWRDSHLRIEGPAAADLAQVFEEDWCFQVGGDPPTLALPPAAGSTAVAIVPSGPDQEENAAGLAWFSAIGLSTQRCWIATPYLVPDASVLRALTGAARRGVDVRVLVPERSDLRLLDFANRSYFPALLDAGVQVFLYQPGMLHCKTAVIDGALSIVGSANVDMRSFGLNFEAGAMVVGPDLAAAMERAYEADLAVAREAKRARMLRVNALARIAQGAAQLLGPLL
jgi:cardiolipin synthase